MHNAITLHRADIRTKARLDYAARQYLGTAFELPGEDERTLWLRQSLLIRDISFPLIVLRAR